MATAATATCNPGALLSWCHVGEGRGLHPRTSGQDQAVNAKNMPVRYGKLLIPNDNCMHMFYVFEWMFVPKSSCEGFSSRTAAEFHLISFIYITSPTSLAPMWTCIHFIYNAYITDIIYCTASTSSASFTSTSINFIYIIHTSHTWSTSTKTIQSTSPTSSNTCIIYSNFYKRANVWQNENLIAAGETLCGDAACWMRKPVVTCTFCGAAWRGRCSFPRSEGLPANLR